jgi:hypothetical protein
VSIGSIQLLKELIDTLADKITIVMYLRRQDRVAVSRYSTQIKCIGDLGFYVSEYDPYYDYLTLYRNWCSVFGKDNVKVKIYDRGEFKNGDLLDDFCSSVNIDYDDMERPENENSSLNRKGQLFLSAVHQYIKETGLEASRSNVYLSRAIKIAERDFKGKHYPITKQEALEFYKKYENSNYMLKQYIAPSQPGTLFSESFSDYPDTINAEEYTESDMMSFVKSSLEIQG